MPSATTCCDHNYINMAIKGVQRRRFFGHFFIFWRKNVLLFVAMCDLVHDAKAIHDLNALLIAPGNLFRNMSNASETAYCSFTGITHISEKISRCC